MTSQGVSVTKKIGRPLKEPTTVMRVPLSVLAGLDAWIAAQPDPKPSRPEALRQLARLGLTLAQAFPAP